MAFVKFVFLADNEVFNISAMDEDHPTAQKWIAGFRSNLKMVKVNSYSNVHQGYYYKNGNFYYPDDAEMKFPLPEEIMDQVDTNRYAGVVENEVIGFMTFIKSDLPEGMFELTEAAMESNPIIMETNNNEVSFGWIWNGTDFIPPLEP
jgi:hypothetical protein